MKEKVEVKTLKQGRYVLIDDEPCTIMGISISKPGKHGSAKSRIDAIGLFDGRKRSIVQPVSAKIDVPIVERKTAQVLSILKDTIQLMDMDDYSTFEVGILDETRSKLEAGKETGFIQYEGKRKIL
jgi:translation initiation factor 5A